MWGGRRVAWSFVKEDFITDFSDTKRGEAEDNEDVWIWAPLLNYGYKPYHLLRPLKMVSCSSNFLKKSTPLFSTDFWTWLILLIDATFLFIKIWVWVQWQSNWHFWDLAGQPGMQIGDEFLRRWTCSWFEANVIIDSTTAEEQMRVFSLISIHSLVHGISFSYLKMLPSTRLITSRTENEGLSYQHNEASLSPDHWNPSYSMLISLLFDRRETTFSQWISSPLKPALINPLFSNTEMSFWLESASVRSSVPAKNYFLTFTRWENLPIYNLDIWGMNEKMLWYIFRYLRIPCAGFKMRCKVAKGIPVGSFSREEPINPLCSEERNLISFWLRSVGR